MTDPIAPRVQYLVVEDRSGTLRLRDWAPFPTEAVARDEAAAYNTDERDRARLERRDVQVVYRVVAATTSYRFLPAPDAD